MQVAIYARVSTLTQQHEGTIASQIQLLKQHVQQQDWALLSEREYIGEVQTAVPADGRSRSR